MFRPKEKVKPYRYFDTPDGEDLVKKLWSVLKPSTLFALGASTVDVMLYSHPKGYMKTFGRFVHISTPIFAVVTTFVLGTNMSARVREKDDKVNWFIGGASAGAVIGAWYRSTPGAFFGGLACGLMAIIKKGAIENDIDLLPYRPKYGRPNFGINYPDYSLTRERPGNWVTELVEEKEIDSVADTEEAVDDEEDDDEENMAAEDFEEDEEGDE